MKSKKILREIPFHPWLFGFYALLALYLSNYIQVESYAMSRGAIFSLVILLLTYVICRIVIRDKIGAGIINSLILFFFYTYGHSYNLISGKYILGVDIGRHTYLALLWVLLGIGSIILTRSLKAHWKTMNVFFNVVSITLTVLTLGQILYFSLASINIDFQQISLQPQETGEKRDIYYIILDGYTRTDILNELGFQNDNFINELTEIGFTVIPCAQSNYAFTLASMTSALNMNYLDEIGLPFRKSDTNFITAQEIELLKHSQVRTILEGNGYQTVAFATKAPWINLKDADYYFEAERFIPVMNRLQTLNFYQLYLNTTVFRFMYDTGLIVYLPPESISPFWLSWVNPSAVPPDKISPDSDIYNSPRYGEYLKNVQSLERLREAPEIPGKKFVYAHLMVTHSSFVINSDGSYKEEIDESATSYFEQITYANEQILEIIQIILDRSAVAPIIIIQADHGYAYASGENKLKILNAYYLPDGGNELLYDSITPVNTFRLVFDYYYDSDLGFIEDRSFVTNPNTDELVEISPACNLKQ